MSWHNHQGAKRRLTTPSKLPSSLLITSGLLRSCNVSFTSDDENPLHLFTAPVQPSKEVKVKMHGYEQYDDSLDIRHRNTGIPQILTFENREEQKTQPPPKLPETTEEVKVAPIPNPLTPTKEQPKEPNKPRPFNPLDLVIQEPPKQVEEQPKVVEETPETDEEFIAPTHHVLESFDKFEYLLFLENETAGWTNKINKPLIQISLKKGSRFNHELPIVRAVFDMELDVQPQELYYLLYDVRTRMGWDSASVAEYVEFERLSADCVLYYMQNKAPWPFSNRDFVEKRMTRTRKNGDLEVCYSGITHCAYPERNKVERGLTIVGGQMFRRKQKADGGFTLFVTVISQADMKGNIPAKAIQETLPSSLEKWYRAVRAALLAKR